MSPEIFKFISATFGVSAAVAAAVIATAIWLTHYVTKKVTKIRCEHEAIRKAHESYSKKVSDMDTDLTYCKSALKSSEKMIIELGEIRRDLSYLKGTIDIIRGGSVLMASHSPVSLTEEGKKIVTEMRGEELINSNWDQIVHNLKLAGDKTPYDIQQLCLESVSVEPERYFKQTDLDKIKDFAFSKGQPLQLYLRVLGLLIRDKYLAEQDIPLSKIDETEPPTQCDA